MQFRYAGTEGRRHDVRRSEPYIPPDPLASASAAAAKVTDTFMEAVGYVSNLINGYEDYDHIPTRHYEKPVGRYDNTPSTQSSQHSGGHNHSPPVPRDFPVQENPRTRGVELQASKGYGPADNHVIPVSARRHSTPEQTRDIPHECSESSDRRPHEAERPRALTSYRSVDGTMRDWMLTETGFEDPTGRLTSVDPKFPAPICKRDEEVAAYNSFVDNNATVHVPGQRNSNYSDTYVDMDSHPSQSQTRLRSVTLGITQDSHDYKAAPEDLVDQHLALCLRKSGNDHRVIRKRTNLYEIDGREVVLEWEKKCNITGKPGYLVVRDGPLRQPASDYLAHSDENQEYVTDDPSKNPYHVKPEKLSFKDDDHQHYTRLEAMRVAKEQAKIRDETVKFNSDGSLTVRGNTEKLERYRKWHLHQLSIEPPYLMQNEQKQSEGQNMQQNSSRVDENGIQRDPTMLPGSAAPFGQINLGMPMPALQMQGLFSGANQFNPFAYH